ncbi:MAG: hypothetical protein JSS65_08700, partial [Armatimonadetes bacterium]|nr:hypothetical protein [Armatimonadota bacterium]
GYGVSPMPNVPVYYPPPPRRPLLSPEAKSTLGNFLKWTMLMGLVILIVIVGINALSSAFGDARPAAPAPTGATGPTPTQESAAATPAPGGPTFAPTGADKQVVNRQQPKVNVDSMIAEATGVIEKATNEDFDTRRQELWEKASKIYATAATSSPADTDRINRAAIDTFVQSATYSANNGRSARAREALYQAQAFTKGQDEDYQKIRQALKLLGG